MTPRILKSRPSRKVVLKQINLLSNQLGLEAPKVKFRQSAGGQYFPWLKRMGLPDPSFIAEGQPGLDWCVYWEIVAHEYAHYVSDKVYASFGHEKQMYSPLIMIALLWEIPLDVLFYEENIYQPRGFKAGAKMAGLEMLGEFRRYR